MKVGNHVPTSVNPCLCCGKECDTATCVGQEGEVRPSSGDITVCLYCGYIMAFDDNLAVRELTQDEMRDIAGDPRILAMQEARGHIRKGYH